MSSTVWSFLLLVLPPVTAFPLLCEQSAGTESEQSWLLCISVDYLGASPSLKAVVQFKDMRNNRNVQCEKTANNFNCLFHLILCHVNVLLKGGVLWFCLCLRACQPSKYQRHAHVGYSSACLPMQPTASNIFAAQYNMRTLKYLREMSVTLHHQFSTYQVRLILGWNLFAGCIPVSEAQTWWDLGGDLAPKRARSFSEKFRRQSKLFVYFII